MDFVLPAKASLARTERILGISFFNGTAREALDAIRATGGCVLLPPSPTLTKLKHDEEYRNALQQADLVLPDSSLLTSLWSLLSARPIRKISGIDYLQCLLEDASFQADKMATWVVSSEVAKENAATYLRAKGIVIDEQTFRVVGGLESPEQFHGLLFEVENRRPENVVLALRSGLQERLGIYLRDYLLYRPRIHCVGAALGFLSGDEAPIPAGFDRHNFGWMARLASQPGMILPRIGLALSVVSMLLRYRSELPPLRPRWSDV